MEKKMIKWILAILMILITIILVICINKYQKNGFKKIEENEITLNTDTSVRVNTNTNNNTNTSLSENKTVSTNNSINNEKNNNYEDKNSKEDKKTNSIEENKKDVIQENKGVQGNNNSTKTIVIDPGHQTKGDSSKEPIGPGATETKANVIMTRTTNNVNISNKERAMIANNAEADAFLRIHADSYSDSKVKRNINIMPNI